MLDCSVPKEDWVQEISERNGVSAPPATHSVGEPVEAGPWEPAIQKIIAFQQLGDDWDGLGAVAPSRELLESAIGLAYLFYERGVDPPHSVVPGLDGSVNFEWQDPDGTITEVEIDRPLHAEVMLIEPGKPPRFWALPTE
ncbi:MAG: hypothetical protein L0Z62_36220 [Gemmataceae bacterium]|nr:hypothetical protein [Gemmataceae bacterium]